MKILLVAGALALAGSGCASGPAADPSGAPPPDVDFVVGDEYRKSVYEAAGETVVSFEIEVTNLGSDAGRPADPRCHVDIRGELHHLEVFENPELAPGERGWFRTGGAIPVPGHGEIDDLEPHCRL